MVTEANHHWSVFLAVLVVIVSVFFVHALVSGVTFSFLCLNNFLYKFVIFLSLDTIRHRALTKDRIRVNHILDGMLPEEVFQLVLNVEKTLADLLLLPLLLVLPGGRRSGAIIAHW